MWEALCYKCGKPSYGAQECEKCRAAVSSGVQEMINNAKRGISESGEDAMRKKQFTIDDIKPCPACASQNAYFRKGECGLHIICDCKRYSTFWHPTLSACIAEWNNRPLEDALQAENEQMKQRIKVLNSAMKEVSIGIRSIIGKWEGEL